MNLTIDIGNTACKLGIFNRFELLHQTYTTAELTIEFLADFIKKEAIDHVILSSVVHHNSAIEVFLQQKKLTILTSNTPLPITVNYQTPQTLGKDRIAGVVAGNMLFPNENILIIDIGTCIKYDFITKKGVYLGGAISPGMKMRFKSLHTFTDQLPLIKNYNLTNWIGNSTENSIISGVINGINNEINGVIQQYEAQFESLKIIITGGGYKSFEKAVKNTIFADQFLLLKGLNAILQYNIKIR